MKNKKRRFADQSGKDREKRSENEGKCMKYFRMEPDKRIQNCVILKLFQTGGKVYPTLEQAKQFQANTLLEVIAEESTIFPDMLTEPLDMVKENIREVIHFYEDSVLWKAVSLFHRESRTLERYFLLFPQRISCLHSETTYFQDGRIQSLILKKEAIKEWEIFQIEGEEKSGIFVSLNIVESVLRRKHYGIRFTEVICR